jgi:hypothetical protein
MTGSKIHERLICIVSGSFTTTVRLLVHASLVRNHRDLVNAFTFKRQYHEMSALQGRNQI